MKDTRFFGPYIKKAIRQLKKEPRRICNRTIEYVWEYLEPEYDVHVSVQLRKKKETK